MQMRNVFFTILHVLSVGFTLARIEVPCLPHTGQKGSEAYRRVVRVSLDVASWGKTSWSTHAMDTRTSQGIVLEGGRILAIIAHIRGDIVGVRVQRFIPDDPQIPIKAVIVDASTSLNLAIIKVWDNDAANKFFDGLVATPLDPKPLPSFKEEVKAISLNGGVAKVESSVIEGRNNKGTFDLAIYAPLGALVVRDGFFSGAVGFLSEGLTVFPMGTIKPFFKATEEERSLELPHFPFKCVDLDDTMAEYLGPRNVGDGCGPPVPKILQRVRRNSDASRRVAGCQRS
eukprot:GHVN01034809.1.p1 GENE.GHVN01034809.1~~GHVN01034809.1.p1  ORF type:complete len:286 (+),score=16.58 GHVN01034809.1:113-970(+)